MPARIVPYNGLQLSANYTWSKSIDDSSIYDGNVSWLANTTSFITGALALKLSF